MKTKFFAVLLALLPISLISCSPKLNPPFPIYQIAIELVDHQGNSLSEVAGINTTGEVFDNNNEKLPVSFSSVVADDFSYFILKADDVTPWPGLPVLTWKLKCKEVFGDQEFHVIESMWEQSEVENQYKRCTSFEFEGKTYVPELKNGYWTARVVVNR